MDKVKEQIERLECIQGKLISRAECLDVNGQDCTKEELYYFCDMIKDVAEAIEKEKKACYYHEVVEAMKNRKEEEELMLKMGIPKEDILSMGYDNWRYSSGRFAPKGRGHYTGGSSGFTSKEWPITADEWNERFEGAEIYDPTRIGMMPMGYSRGGSSNSGRGGNNSGNSSGSERRSSSNSESRGNNGSSGDSYGYNDGNHMMDRSRYGENYDMYKNARRHYTETGNESDRSNMKDGAMHHLKDVEYTMNDIWKDADPDMRKQMKNDLTKLVDSLKV